MYKLDKRYTISFFFLVCLFVIPNLLTPLRLNTDAIRYLNIVEYLKGNLDSTSDAAHDFFPHGYPFFLLFLNRFHLPVSLFITFVNILSVILSGYLLAVLLKIEDKFLFMTITLLSFINIKQFTLPIADELFSLVLLTGIYLWTRVFQKQWYFLLPALIVTAVSLYLRTAGISLIMGIVLYIIYLLKDKLISNKPLLYGSVGTLVVFSALFFLKLPLLEKKVEYIHQLSLGEMLQNPVSILQRLAIHLQELGEILLNIPYSKLYYLNSAYPKIGIGLLIICGMFVCHVFVKAILKLRIINTLVFWVFAFYLFMIFLWPYYDARFFTPAIPLLLYALAYYASTILKPVLPRVIWACCFVITGFIGLIYSDGISVSHNFFLKNYGADPSLTAKYSVYFNTLDVGQNIATHYKIRTDNVLYLLHTYDTTPFLSQKK